MDWLGCIRKTIELLEERLTEEVDVREIAAEVYLSPFFLQKGFSVMTGYTMAEYVRNRRLYQAALDLRIGEGNMLDISLKYGYETPESFSRAFTRFHGATPKQVKAGAPIYSFLPLKVEIYVIGGNQMQAKIKDINTFKIVGFAKEMSCAEEFSAIPKFWDEINERYAGVYAGNEPKNPLEEAVTVHNIGEYGVCIGQGNGKTLYIIAGEYKGGEVPNGLTMYELNGGDYAIFDCVGPMPNAIQEVTTRIFKEWLPDNPDYEWKKEITVEWYDFKGRVDAPDYHSAIWLPVQRKAK